MKPELKNIDKILIIQFKPHGDVLLTTSYLETLRNKFPESQIDFLVTEPYHQILEKNPYLSEVIVLPRKRGAAYLCERIKLFRKIRHRKYDLIIDQQNSTGSAQVVLWSGARYRLGWIDGKGRWFYNLKAPRGSVRYNASRKFDILQPLGVTEQPYKLYYYIKPASKQYIESWLSQENLLRKPMICISPGSPVPRKKWNLKNYARLADLIFEQTDFSVVLLWGPNELDDIKIIQEQMVQKPIIAPPTDFNQAAAFLTYCRLLICNDGGLNHLSVATDTPALALFGPTSPTVWSPHGVIPFHYHLYNPTWEKNSNQTFGITPEESFNKVQEILTELKNTHA